VPNAGPPLRRRALFLPAALLALVACTSTPSRDTASALPAASLPDLSRSETTVQQQVSERARALRALIAGNRSTPPELAHAYGEVGSLLLAANYIDAAEPYYLHAQALEPQEMRWPYYLGHVYMAKPDAARAIASFEQARRLRPDDVATLVWLGKVYLDQGHAESATPLFSHALAIDPHTVAAMYGLGQAALAARDYAGAAQRFEQVLAADPRASIAHYPLSLAYRAMGETAKAEAHLRQQGRVEVGPPDPLMTELRGLLHGSANEQALGVRALEGGDYATAVAHLRQAVALAPDDPALRQKLGTALSLSGDPAAALAEFEDVVRRSPDFAPARYSLGVMLAANGRTAEAIEQLAAAVRSDPSYTDARGQLAATLARGGQFDRALAQYKELLAIDPAQPDAQFGYAMTLVGLRRYREARAALAAGAEAHPDDRRFADAIVRLRSAP
jgi:tetratricopeptide (TPR) repeat protein